MSCEIIDTSTALSNKSCFLRGQLLKPTDLFVRFSASAGCSGLADPYSITYAIYEVLDDNTEVLVSPTATETPTKQAVGYYYVNWTIPATLGNGNYRLRWTVLEAMGQPEPTFITEDFCIKSIMATQGSTGDTRLIGFVNSLRTLLRDNNPDRNYHFRPPSSESFLHQQTQKFGFIWTDDELVEYSQMATDLLNAWPPLTAFTISNYPSNARTLLLYGAAYHAVMAVTLNWIEEEFSYSIGGISLDIEKSSKYESMKNNLEQLWSTGVEKYKSSIKIIKGLQQPRYNAGARSLFGPYTGRQVLSIRQLVSPSRQAHQ